MAVTHSLRRTVGLPIRRIILIAYAPESPWYLVRAETRKGRLLLLSVRIHEKGSAVDWPHTVAMMARTDEHETVVSVGIRFVDCFKGSDLGRTEIASR